MSANRMATSCSPPWRLRLAAIGLDRAAATAAAAASRVDVAGRRAELAGEPHIGRRADAASAPSLLSARRRHRVAILAADAHPAGRAAAAPAAHRGMRDAGKPAHLQDGEPRRAGSSLRAFAVIETHHAGAAFPEVAQRRAPRTPNSRTSAPIWRCAKWRRGCRCRRAAAHARGRTGFRGSPAAGQDRRHRAGQLPRPDDARDGHEQGDGVERRQPGGIPGFQAPREVEADAGMQPDHQGQQELAGDGRPVAGDQRSQHPGIAGLHADTVRAPGACRRHGARPGE